MSNDSMNNDKNEWIRVIRGNKVSFLCSPYSKIKPSKIHK
jgi:hypothetical protein